MSTLQWILAFLVLAYHFEYQVLNLVLSEADMPTMRFQAAIKKLTNNSYYLYPVAENESPLPYKTPEPYQAKSVESCQVLTG